MEKIIDTFLNKLIDFLLKPIFNFFIRWSQFFYNFIKKAFYKDNHQLVCCLYIDKWVSNDNYKRIIESSFKKIITNTKKRYFIFSNISDFIKIENNDQAKEYCDKNELSWIVYWKIWPDLKEAWIIVNDVDLYYYSTVWNLKQKCHIDIHDSESKKHISFVKQNIETRVFILLFSIAWTNNDYMLCIDTLNLVKISDKSINNRKEEQLYKCYHRLFHKYIQIETFEPLKSKEYANMCLLKNKNDHCALMVLAYCFWLEWNIQETEKYVEIYDKLYGKEYPIISKLNRAYIFLLKNNHENAYKIYIDLTETHKDLNQNIPDLIVFFDKQYEKSKNKNMKLWSWIINYFYWDSYLWKKDLELFLDIKPRKYISDHLNKLISSDQ